MRYVKHMAWAVVSLALLGGTAWADDLTGTWKIDAGVKNGEKLEKEKLEPVTVDVTKDKITLTNSKENAKFLLSYTAKDGKVEMTIDEGPEGAKGMKAKGIVEVKDDTMKLCYSLGGEAPTKFESKADSNTFFFTLKKEKKEKK